MILNNSTPKILSRYGVTKFFLFIFLSLSICIISCDESSVVGLDVQPSNDLLNVNFQDTTTIITKTVREDSLRTDETVIIGATSLIGKYIDPIFGMATASLYTQVALSTNITSTSFGTSPVCDSIVLSLVYDPIYYGKKERKQQTLNVYEVTEDIPSGTKFSNKTLSKSVSDLASGYNFIPKPSDSVLLDGVKIKPTLRVPLDKINFGQKLLDEGVTGTGLTNKSAFFSYMKGLYVTTESTTGLLPGEGDILNFKLAESKITLYYQNSTDDSLKYEFSLNGGTRFSYFTHDYTSADANLVAQLSGTPPTQNDVVFLQSMAGVKTKIELPNIMHWNDSGAVAINKAELIIKIDQNSAYQLDTFAAPEALILFGIDDSGNNYLVPDGFEGSNYFGGTYDASTKEYHFNIARYIQQVLNKKLSNNGLHLLASSGAINANRVAIGGGGTGSSYKMKLNITYTKLH